jgi:excinuclease ABC subunit A
MEGVTRNNLKNLSVGFPLGTLIAVTGVSGSGKSSLVSQALVELIGEHLGHSRPSDEVDADPLAGDARPPSEGRIVEGLSAIKRLVQVDQKPIGRTPRSNLATYTGLFDHVRRIFADTKAARARHYTAGRFSFNVVLGRCETCEGEGFVCVELLFMPSVSAPCSTCHGARYNAKTLEIQYRGKNIAEVLAMTVDGASQFFAEQPQVSHALLRFCRKSAWDTCGSDSPRLNYREAKRSASSSPPNCSATSEETRCMFSTNRPPDCIRPMFKDW